MPVHLSIALGCLLSLGSAWTAGMVVSRRLDLPWAVRCSTGAAIYSLLVFALLQVHLGYGPVFWLVGTGLGCAAWKWPPVASIAVGRQRAGWPTGLFFLAVFGAYGFLYLVHGAAPEIEADAVAYHLRMVSDYVRAHGFTGKSAFFDVMPQPVEMLFVPAFTVGAHSAAKLVHLGLLVAATAIVREVALELGLSGTAAWGAAALFFVTPVCGLAGTSAYTDCGLAAFSFATFYLLLRWDRERDPWLLLVAAINAGTCYAVKQTFGWVAVVAFVFILVRSRRWRPCAVFAGGVLAAVAPWMFRAYAIAGNPFAPFFTTPGLDAQLAHSFSAFRPGFAWQTVFWDYTMRGGNQGVLGPALLLVPVACLGLRRRATATALLASAALALPILANTGTRFLIPALGPAAIAMVSVLPTPAVIALVTIQAIGSAPDAVDVYARNEWRFGELPWEAALRLEPEKAYLARRIPSFPVAKLIDRETLPGSRILNFGVLPEVYVDRDTLIPWQSATGRRLSDGLIFALDSEGGNAGAFSWRSAGMVSVTARSELRVVETRPESGLAWKNFLPGEGFQFRAPAEVVVWPADARFSSTGAEPVAGTTFHIDLRRDAAGRVLGAGYRHILIPVSTGPFAPLGRDLLHHADEWGVRALGVSGEQWLFAVSTR